MKRIVTLGEPMTMFVADEVGPLDEIDHYTKFVAGAELNVAIGLARLGNFVTYVTRLGDDPFGKYIHRLLRETGLDEAGVAIDDTYPTGFQLKSKVTTGDPEVVYFRKNSAASHLSRADIEHIDLTNVHHVHVTGIPLALSADAREAEFALIKKAKEQGIRVSFDPNLRPSLWPDIETMVETVNQAAALCDIVFPGVGEGAILTGSSDERAIAAFYRQLGVSGTIVKLGPHGAYVDVDGEQYVVPSFSVDDVVDTVGAGDGFAVGVISGLLDGLSLRDAVVRGNAIGAMQVMVPGDNEGLPNQAQLSAFLTGHRV
ncbi:sugar kinase [Alicyclobacillus mengziensis]|uniref:Sugar kinase n=1 Tax=Alicyclobacillus mengziensis TaxID=2931921 RepID=A0A9X7VZA1_9BACL|nr:sugar kinase [Alicyclobacillus mengziensis]QSO47325.1 sugar kinase [Alicyclobacillus mengziensis]